MKMKLPIVRAAFFEVFSVIKFLDMKEETSPSIHAEITCVYKYWGGEFPPSYPKT